MLPSRCPPRALRPAHVLIAKSRESKPRILTDSPGVANQKAAALFCGQAPAAHPALQQRLHRVRSLDGALELADLPAGEAAQALGVGLAAEQRADLADREPALPREADHRQPQAGLGSVP